MPLTAIVTLRRGRYEASGSDDRYPESLPSPFRLFSALVAVAAREGDPGEHPGLRWLEDQPPPAVIRPPVLDQGRTDAFHVTNAVKPSGGSMSHVGRANGQKHRSWITFAGDTFRFEWPALPDPKTLTALQALANGITYLGRVEGPVVVRFDDQDVEPSEHDERYEPVESGRGRHEVPVPYSGSLEALIDVFERGDSPWQVARPVSYAPPKASQPAVRRAFSSMLIYRIEGQPVAGSNALDVASALRAAVMSRVSAVTGHEAVPASVHGHLPNAPHVAYLALPTVGNKHADGRVRGVALALPADLPPSDQRLLGQALDVEPGLTQIAYARGPRRPDGERSLDLQRVFPGDEIRTTSVPAWESSSGATTWATATPLMLDRFPHRNDNPAQMVAQSAVEAGYPEPEEVELAEAPFLSGAVRYRSGWQRSLGRRPARPVFHARLRFPEPVLGPVVVGALRFIGGGLFWPIPSSPWDQQ